MAKKVAWIVIIIILWILVYSVDKMRVEKNEKPWFCFPIEVSESGTGYYYGLGYKTYVVTIKNQKGNYEISDVKLGHWFENLK